MATPSNDLIAPPLTPHLHWLGHAKAHDKVLPVGVARAILARPVVIEELADGATIGLSSDGDSVWAERRQVVLGPGAHPQFQTLWGWLAEREEQLVRALDRQRVLFGAWCYATHGVRHDALPDWFIASDVYDRGSGKFWSADRRNRLCRELGIVTAPEVARTKTDVAGLLARLGGAAKAGEAATASEASALGSGPVAGLVVRLEHGGARDTDHLIERAQVVCAAVADAPEEPSTRKTLERNRLAGP